MTTQTPFLVEPDGATDLGETLSFLTDVETHRDGSERRSAARAYPRLKLTADYTFLRGDAESLLAPLNVGETLLVPAWPHQFYSVGGAAPVADRGVPLVGEQPFLVRSRAGAWRTQSFGFSTGGQLTGWSSADYMAVPVYVAELTEDTVSKRFVTPVHRSVSLAFDVQENFEAPAPWSEAELSFPLRHDWTVDVEEVISFRTNRFDAGNIRLREKLYSKRSVSVAVVLTSRAAIGLFRQWVYATRGRLNSFTWRAPQDTEECLWRLASDDIELRYVTPSKATCSLTFIETTT